jgi:hypothetical protein
MSPSSTSLIPRHPDEQRDVRGEPRDGPLRLERSLRIAHANLRERDVPPPATRVETASNIASAARIHLFGYVTEMRVDRKKLHFECSQDYGTRHITSPVSAWRLMSVHMFKRCFFGHRQLPKIGPMAWMRSLQPTPNQRAIPHRESGCLHDSANRYRSNAGPNVSLEINSRSGFAVGSLPFRVSSDIRFCTKSLFSACLLGVRRIGSFGPQLR